MYEPAWYPDKTHTAIAQAIAAAAAALLLLLVVTDRKKKSASPIRDASGSELPS